MSYIPKLRTPLDRNQRNRNGMESTLSGMDIKGGNPINGKTTSRVRFSSIGNNPNPRSGLRNANTSISLDQDKRERRKHEALAFLKRETGDTSRYGNYGVNKTKTYDLLGEEPIKNLSSTTTAQKLNLNSTSRIFDNKLNLQNSLYDDDMLKRIRRESLRRNPLSSSLPTNSNRIRKPDILHHSKSYVPSKNNKGLLNSLSNLGSKVFKSIIYNEEDTTPSNAQNINSSFDLTRLQRLNMEEKELEAKLEAKRKYLNQINMEIDASHNKFQNIHTNVSENIDNGIDNSIKNLDTRLQNIIEEVSSSSNIKLMTELDTIKNELNSLRRRQESNNIKFESRFEDMKLESQLNRQKFDKLFTELDQKSKELDQERETFFRLLQTNHKKNKTGNSSGVRLGVLGTEDTSALKMKNGKDSDSDDSISGEDDNDNDENLIRYILKTRRQRTGADSKIHKAEKVNKKMKNLKSRLKHIEKMTDYSNGKTV